MVQVDAVDDNGADVELQFEGECLGAGVYRTDEGKAVLVDGQRDDAYSVWTPDEIAEDQDRFCAALWVASERDGECFADALRAFGVKQVIRL